MPRRREALILVAVFMIASQLLLVSSVGYNAYAFFPLYDLNSLGRNATLSEVMVAMNLSQPTYLPQGTSLYMVRLSGNRTAALVYTNPNLTRIDGYRQDVQIVILAQRDGTSYETYGKGPSLMPITIAGNPGYGVVNTDYGYTHGEVQWWSNKIHYEMLTTLSLQEMVKIAESIRPVLVVTSSLTNTFTSTTQLSSVTVTFEKTLTTTFTTTTISAEQVADPSTLAWAASATVAAMTLAVVLLLQGRTK